MKGAVCAFVNWEFRDFYGHWPEGNAVFSKGNLNFILLSFALTCLVITSFRGLHASYLKNKGSATTTAEATTKAQDPKGWYGWYAIEKPTMVVPNIFKYKIARGPKEPSIEAFAIGDMGLMMLREGQFPQRILWTDVKSVGAIFDPMGGSVPVNFLEPKTK